MQPGHDWRCYRLNAREIVVPFAAEQDIPQFSYSCKVWCPHKASKSACTSALWPRSNWPERKPTSAWCPDKGWFCSAFAFMGCYLIKAETQEYMCSVSHVWTGKECHLKYIPDTLCHAPERSALYSFPDTLCHAPERSACVQVYSWCPVPRFWTFSTEKGPQFFAPLPGGMNMCDNCQNPHDTSSHNSCASAQHGMLPACVSTHKNFFFLLKTLFVAVYTSCPFLCRYSLHYFSLE